MKKKAKKLSPGEQAAREINQKVDQLMRMPMFGFIAVGWDPARSGPVVDVITWVNNPVCRTALSRAAVGYITGEIAEAPVTTVEVA